MRQIGENLTDTECKEIIAAGDQDNDNYLNFDDFIKMMIDRKWLKKSKYCVYYATVKHDLVITLFSLKYSLIRN